MPLDNTTGYLEQGYANVAAAPLDMQLDQIQMRRTVLSQAQSNLRTSNFKEEQRLENEMRKDKYFAFMEQQADNPNLTDQGRLDGQNEFIKDNPGMMGSSDVMEMVGGNITRTTEHAGLSLANITKARNQATQALDAIDKTSDARQKLAEKDIEVRMKALQNKAQTISDQGAMVAQGKTDYIATSVSNVYGNSPEDEKAKTAAVALADTLSSSEDQKDRDLLTAVGVISSGLQFGSELSEVYSSSLYRHDFFIKEVRDGLGGDLLRNFQDPATRQERVVKLAEEIEADRAMKGEKSRFTDDTRPRMDAFLEDLAKITSVQRTYNELKTDYSAGMQELWALRGKIDPESQKRTQEITSKLKVQGAKVRVWVSDQYKKKKTNEDTRNRELKQKQVIQKLRLDLKSSDLAERKEARMKLTDAHYVNYRNSENIKDAHQAIFRMDQDGLWDDLGLEDASRAEKMSYFDKVFSGKNTAPSGSSGGGTSIYD